LVISSSVSLIVLKALKGAKLHERLRLERASKKNGVTLRRSLSPGRDAIVE